jgi:hypothetical protein
MMGLEVMMRSRLALFLILAAVSVAGKSLGEPQPLRPRVLIVFKNGLSWIEHRGEVPLKDGWGALPTTPEAVLGTVSLTSDTTKIDEVRTVGLFQNAARGLSLEMLLTRNAGRMVSLRAGDREIRGRLLSVPESSAPVDEAVRYAYGQPPAGVVLLEADGKTIAIQRALVTAVTFDGQVTTADDAPNPMLRFHVTNPSASTPLKLSYVRPGIGWLPDYSISLDGNGAASLVLRATLVNDGEELDATDVFFAVGYPNFAFGSIESPLSARQSLAELFRMLGGGANGGYQVLVNANIASQMSMPDTGRNSAFTATTTAGTEGESADDFFLYSRKSVTLPKGARAAFPLLEASAKYSDVYTLDIPRDAPADPYNRPAEAPPADKIWHSIRLSNPTKLPWTTAPALVFANGRPVAQETLRYTPALGATTLRLTVANNVIAERSESEVARARESFQRFGYTWDIVTIEGTVSVRNYKDEPIVLAISREIEGEAVPGEGLRTTRVAMQPRAMNPIEALQWEVPLAAGEKKTIKYQYKVYVRG